MPRRAYSTLRGLHHDVARPSFLCSSKNIVGSDEWIIDFGEELDMMIPTYLSEWYLDYLLTFGSEEFWCVW